VRVGIITTSYPRHVGDFAGSFVADLAGSLARAGLAVTVWAPHARGLAGHEMLDGVMVKRFRYMPEGMERVAYGDGIANNVRHDGFALLGLPMFVRALRRVGAEAGRSCDVLHVNWAQPAAFVADGRPQAPMVVTLHGTDVRAARGGGRMYRELVRAANCPPTREIIAVSDELAAEVRRLLEARALPPIEVVPTGVESELIERERLTRHAKGPLRLVYVGRLLESKGVLDLAEAFVDLQRDATLTVCGDGPERSAMEQRLRDAGLLGRVEFTGALPRPEALDLMADSDVVVVPSHEEGCGVVAIEASALGVPAVATRVGVHPQLLVRDELLFEPGDTPSLVARLRRLADDVSMRRSLGEASRVRAAEQYTWDALAPRIIGVYERAIEGARG
jgi:glycosyltransferase involved in cell wall biosynthesis